MQSLLTAWIWCLAVWQGEVVDNVVLAELRSDLVAAELEENERQVLSTVLDEAAADLSAATESSSTAERFAALTDSAPGRIEALRLRLSEPPGGVDLGLPDGATLGIVADHLQRAEADRDAAQADLEALGAEPEQRSDRQVELVAEIARVRGALTEARAESDAFPRSQGLGSRIRAARLQARVQRLAEELREDESELGSYAARIELLPLRRDEAQRRLGSSEALVAALRERASELRRAEADRLARESEAVRESTEVELLRRLTDQNETWARQHAEQVTPSVELLVEVVDAQRKLADSLEDELETLREKVAVGRRTEQVAIDLRSRYESLPPRGDLGRSAARYAREASDAHYRSIEWRELFQRWSDVGVSVGSYEAELAEQTAALASDERERAVRSLRSLLESRRDILASLERDSNRELELTWELEGITRRRAKTVDEARRFIEEHILWLRSIYQGRIPSGSTTLAALLWLFDPAELARGVAIAVEDAWDRPLAPLGLLALLALLGATRWRARARLTWIGTQVASFRTDSYVWTLRAFLLTAVLAGFFPLLLWVAGWLLVRSPDQVANARALGVGLQGTGRLLLPLLFLARVVGKDGLGLAHFRWSERAIGAIRVHLRWFVPAVVPLATIAIAFESQTERAWSHSAGRIAFCAGLALLFVLLRRVLRPGGELAGEVKQNPERGWVVRLYRFWYPAAIAAPLLLIGLSAAGWYYTAWQLEERLEDSLGYALGIVLAHALMLRWLFVVRRKLSIEQARARARARSEATDALPGEAQPFEEDKVDIPALDQKTRQLFRTATLLASVFGFMLIWSAALPALRVLDRIQVWPEVRLVDTDSIVRPTLSRSAGSTAEAGVGSGEKEAAGSTTSPPLVRSPLMALQSGEESPSATVAPDAVTLADVGLALIIIVVMFAAARNLPGLLEFLLLQRLPLDAGARYAISSVVRYAILLFGATSAMAAIHIGWSQIQWLAAALTFGLAFGLQEVFSNFISGLIILFERPFQVGDIVTVGGIEGRVTKIRMRATTILDWDRRELLVPNREFITGQLVNWTLSDPISRIIVPVGIAYGSDTRKARDLLLRAAQESHFVVEEPAPQVAFLSFGESSLDFQLRIFIPTRDVWAAATHDIHLRIDDLFRDGEIEISFPQRDLHVRTAPGLAELDRNPPTERDSTS